MVSSHRQGGPAADGSLFSAWARAENFLSTSVVGDARRDATAMLLMWGARAVSNHEGGPSFETRPPRPEERTQRLEGRPLLRMRPPHPSRRIAQSASADCAMSSG